MEKSFTELQITRVIIKRMFLEPIKNQYQWITYADLWTLAGVVAVQDMGGPKIEWKPGISLNYVSPLITLYLKSENN